MSNMWVGFCLQLLLVVAPVLSVQHPDGTSIEKRTQDPSGNYQFSYTVSTAEGEHFRREGTDALGRVVGSYGLTHADGRQRVVDYVADKDGFQAQVRSNEMKHVMNAPLEAAASDPEESYGTRLKSTASRVSYAGQVGPNLPLQRPRPYRPEIAAPSYPDVYFPPIDPHAGIRGPHVPPRTAYRPATTSRRPFVPPYGGFDDDSPIRVRPGEPLTPPPLLPSSYDVGRHPATYGLSRPPISVYGLGRPPASYGVERLPSSIGVARPLVFGQRGLSGESPNLVLRAVPIPNGIQAVRVDPSTGRVHDRLAYPLYPGRLYNRDVLLHHENNEDDDERLFRHYDIPLRRRLSLRGAGEGTLRDSWNNDTYSNNENNLDKPSAKDLESVYRQIASVDGFGEGAYDEDTEGRLPVDIGYIDGLEREPIENGPQEFGPLSKILSNYRASERPDDDELSPFLGYRQLTPVDSKELALSGSEEEETKTKSDASEIEKE